MPIDSMIAIKWRGRNLIRTMKPAFRMATKDYSLHSVRRSFNSCSRNGQIRAQYLPTDPPVGGQETRYLCLLLTFSDILIFFYNIFLIPIIIGATIFPLGIIITIFVPIITLGADTVEHQGHVLE